MKDICINCKKEVTFNIIKQFNKYKLNDYSLVECPECSALITVRNVTSTEYITVDDKKFSRSVSSFKYILEHCCCGSIQYSTDLICPNCGTYNWIDDEVRVTVNEESYTFSIDWVDDYKYLLLDGYKIQIINSKDVDNCVHNVIKLLEEKRLLFIKGGIIKLKESNNYEDMELYNEL